jgi:hypothetical protein
MNFDPEEVAIFPLNAMAKPGNDGSLPDTDESLKGLRARVAAFDFGFRATRKMR